MEKINKKTLTIVIVATALVTALLLMLVVSVSVRQTESDLRFVLPEDGAIAPLEPDSSEWGRFYPQQYESWKRTDQIVEHSDNLEVSPANVILFAGYAFSRDYNSPRGHQYAVTDIHNILRTGTPQEKTDGPMPGTCWTCKSSDVPRLMDELTPAGFYSSTWAELGEEINFSIGCADCHDSNTMELVITRPALQEALAAQGRDHTKLSHQEKRSLVCAQCHVEYYFSEGAYLVFPWTQGRTVEEMQQHNESRFTKRDWTHQISGARMWKSQHPDYEIFELGIHAKNDVACVDCHMPYSVEGGRKFTDHKVQSPLNNIANTCQTCHRKETGYFISVLEQKKKAVLDTKSNLEDQLIKGHFEVGRARELGATDEQLESAVYGLVTAQWEWDNVSASHGVYFHATDEALRILAQGIDRMQKARSELQTILTSLNGWPMEYPDVSTKEKAQAYLGIDVDALRAAKNEWINTTMTQWGWEQEF